MADEGNESRAGRMDLNLYLGPTRSPRPRSSDLGSDLALSSLPLSTSSTTDESRAPLEMSGGREPIDSHAPYSPSHASFTPEPSVPPLEPSDPRDTDFNQEYNPYSPSYAAILPEPEEPGSPGSPRFAVHPLPILQEAEEPPSPYTPSYIPLDPQEANDDLSLISPLRSLSPLMNPFVPPMLPDVSMYAPPFPSYVPRSPSYSPPSPLYSPRGIDDELLGGDDEPSLRQELLRRDLVDTHAYRLRRLIDSSHGLRLRRFRSSHMYSGSERSDLDSGRPGRSVSHFPEQQVTHDTTSPQRPLETNGKDKAQGVGAESSEEEKEDKGNAAVNFECNICLDMAQEPVVTSCGHLFCWPCLYQWLHVHSEHKECPVCKGEVTESNITPIYGRGSSEASDGKKPAEAGESNVKIPPRPHGNRVESFRQQFRPVSRRFAEGFTASWRRLVNQQLRSRNRFDGRGEPYAFSATGHAGLTRLRARRLRRDEMGAEIGPEAEDVRFHRANTSTPQSSSMSPLLRDGFDLWSTPTHPSAEMSPLMHDRLNVGHQPRGGSPIPRSSGVLPIFHDRIEPWHRLREGTPIPRNSGMDLPFPDRAEEFWHRLNVFYTAADIGRVSGHGNRHGASTSSVNPSSPELVIPRGNVASASAADQVSASSTTAMIQGDVGLPEGSADPDSAGSSRSLRRRGRASGSLDVDGVLHARKRRRLN